MNKKTLNIISVCIVALVIVFILTNKKNTDGNSSDNISFNEDGKIQTKADQYQANILETVENENIKSFENFSQSFKKNSSDNMTDGLSKDVFTQYIKYNTSGEIDKNDILNATQSVLKNKDSIQNPVVYGDIKISLANIENLKIYGNNVAIVQDAVNKGIASINNKSNQTPYLASIYLKSAEILTTTEVPDLLSASHINLINGLKKYSEGLVMMDEQLADPAKALLGLNKVKDATAEILTSFDKIKKTIILNKINYAESDPGYFWLINNSYNTSIKSE